MIRVLHVDDDDLGRKAFARFLQHEPGIEVSSIATVQEAMRVIASGGGEAAFDAVVTDLEMPGHGGDDLHRWLSERYPRLAARTIVYTGGTTSEAREAWLRSLPPGRVILKPSSVDVLVIAIQAATLR